jgi:hypothetical protein
MEREIPDSIWVPIGDRAKGGHTMVNGKDLSRPDRSSYQGNPARRGDEAAVGCNPSGAKTKMTREVSNVIEAAAHSAPVCRCGAVMGFRGRDMDELNEVDANLIRVIQMVPSDIPRIRICFCYKCGFRKVQTISAEQLRRIQ